MADSAPQPAATEPSAAPRAYSPNAVHTLRTYRPRERLAYDWWGSVVRPAVPTGAVPTRTGDGLLLQVVQTSERLAQTGCSQPVSEIRLGDCMRAGLNGGGAGLVRRVACAAQTGLQSSSGVHRTPPVRGKGRAHLLHVLLNLQHRLSSALDADMGAY